MSAGALLCSVVGQVAGWGRVIEHAKGWRAAKIYPLSLALICGTCSLAHKSYTCDANEMELVLTSRYGASPDIRVDQSIR